MKKLLVLAPLYLMLTDCGNAQSTQKIDCENAQTQNEMNACVLKAYQESDKELNQVYKEVMAQLNPASKVLLVQAQKSWLVVRDNHCKLYEQFYEGGSIMPLMVTNCSLELTNNRIKELRVILDELQPR